MPNILLKLFRGETPQQMVDKTRQMCPSSGENAMQCHAGRLTCWKISWLQCASKWLNSSMIVFYYRCSSYTSGSHNKTILILTRI